MEKNNQPLILGTIVIGAVLIIALALIFTRSSDDTVTETTSENNASENEEKKDMEGNGENGQQPSPVPPPIPVPNPPPTPDPQPGVLPSNWNSLTSREKTDLNPFNCDIETQWISAENGTCIDKPAPAAATAPLQYLDHDFVSCNHENVSEGECDVFIRVLFLSTIDLEQAVSNPSSLPPFIQEVILNNNGECLLQFAPEFATLSKGQVQPISHLIGVWPEGTDCIEALGALEQGIEQYITITMTGISEGVSLNLKTTPETTLTLTDFEIVYPITPATE